MTIYAIYLQKPQASGNPFAAPAASGLSLDDAAYQNNPCIVGLNTSFPVGAAGKLLFVQTFLRQMQDAYEEEGHDTRRGYRYVATSDGGTTFINPRDL